MDPGDQLGVERPVGAAGGILEASAQIRAHADGLAELFEGVWREHIWEPFVAAGMPDHQLPAIGAAVERVRPLALDAVVEIFTIAMEERIAKSIAAELQRAGEEGSGE